MRSKHTLPTLLWDIFCLGSIVGIWPRFIETKLICTTALQLALSSLPNGLEGLKILQLSDLHFSKNMSDRFLKRIIRKTQKLSPDIIVLTGDLLCYGKLADPDRLKKFLNQFQAPYGCYAVLGNHDYAECISINSAGDYDTVKAPASLLARAFGRLFAKGLVTGVTTQRAQQTSTHSDLISLLAQTPFKLLHNTTEILAIKNTKLNICGLGEYSAGRCHPREAFQNYDKNYPGIVLLHNPDGAVHLRDYPGEIILSGHTHGGQVNLPWLWKKFTLMEDTRLKSGLINLVTAAQKVKGPAHKSIYVNRGIGSILPFRWFSPPEILLLTLRGKP